MPRYIYSGDVNAEYGGVFYDPSTWETDGYASATRIQPCSDAGGPDNCYWIESVTINRKKGEELERALRSCGPDLEDYAKLKGAAKRNAEIEACLSYGFYDQYWSKMVRIGPPDPYYNSREGEFNPDVILPSGSSIRNYARRQCE